MHAKVFKDPQITQRTWDLNGKDLTQATIHYIELTQYEKFTIVFDRINGLNRMTLQMVIQIVIQNCYKKTMWI